MVRLSRYGFGLCSAAVAVFCLTLPIQAEMYVAGQVGVNIPQSLSNVQYSIGGSTLGGNDLSLQNSLIYGARIGYYFDKLKWHKFNLGIETEVFNSQPNIKPQNLSIGGFNFGPQPGVDFRVLNWAPVNIVHSNGAQPCSRP